MRGAEKVASRTLLLATGVIDELPAIPGAQDFYGVGVHHCPYCDGWEYRDKPLAAYGARGAGLGLALSLLTWSDEVTVVTNGEPLDAATLAKARRFGVPVRTEKIVELRSRGGKCARNDRDPLSQVAFASGPAVHVAAIFFNTARMQRSQLAKQLGCRMNENGGVVHDRRQRTGVVGLYLAGDASFDVQFVVVAAAEGAKAGVAMNRYLQDLDRKESRRVLRQ
jgi:thioredoxin reductase